MIAFMYASKSQLASARVAFFHDDRERLLPAVDQELDQAAARGQIHAVELADHRGHEQDGDLPHLGGGRLVLKELVHRLAKHDRTGRGGDRLADHETGRIDVRRDPGRRAHVADQGHGADHEVPAALIDHRLQRCRVGPRVVRRSERVDQVVDHQPEFLLVLPIEVGFLDERARFLGENEVALEKTPEQPALGPGGIAESPVPTRGGSALFTGNGTRKTPAHARGPTRGTDRVAHERENQATRLGSGNQPATSHLGQELVEAEIVSAGPRGSLCSSVGVTGRGRGVCDAQRRRAVVSHLALLAQVRI